MSASLPNRLGREDGPPSVEWVPVPAVIDSRGDKVVTLLDESGRPRTRRVAELVLEAFAGPCPPGHELRFKDGDRLNCSLENLVWAYVVAPGTSLTSRPGTTRPVRIDEAGHLLSEDGKRLVVPGLEPEKVRQGLADADAGRVRPLHEVLSEVQDEL